MEEKVKVVVSPHADHLLRMHRYRTDIGVEQQQHLMLYALNCYQISYLQIQYK